MQNDGMEKRKGEDKGKKRKNKEETECGEHARAACLCLQVSKHQPSRNHNLRLSCRVLESKHAATAEQRDAERCVQQGLFIIKLHRNQLLTTQRGVASDA